MDPQRRQRRCPRLGGEVSFAYCQHCGEEQAPCFKVLDCWWERFDVVAHLQAVLPPETLARVMAPPRAPTHKVSSLVALILKARERNGS